MRDRTSKSLKSMARFSLFFHQPQSFLNHSSTKISTVYLQHTANGAVQKNMNYKHTVSSHTSKTPSFQNTAISRKKPCRYYSTTENNQKNNSTNFRFNIIKIATLSAMSFGILSFFCFNHSLQCQQKTDKNTLRTIGHAFRLLQAGNIEKAYLLLIKLSQFHPTLKKAILLFEAEKFDEAVESLENFFSDEINKPEIYFVAKGIFLNALGKFDLAISCFDKSLKSHHPYIQASASFHKRVALSLMGNKEEAEKCFSVNINDYKEISRFLEAYYNLNKFLQNYMQINSRYSNFKENLGGMTSFPIYFLIGQTPKLQMPFPTYLLATSVTDYNKPIDPKKRVTLRVWLPDSEGYFGHASVETNKYYISFWPSQITEEMGIVKDTAFSFSSVNFPAGCKWNTLLDDFEVEGRLPDYRISLYKLDAAKVNQTKEEIIQTNINWKLIPLFSQDHNCSGIVAYLLYKGGLISVKTYLNESWIIMLTTAAAATSSIWAPILSVPAALIPVVGPVFSAALQQAPVATTLAAGAAIALINDKIITPKDIAELAVAAKKNEEKQNSDLPENSPRPKV